MCLTNRYYDPGTARFLTRDPIGYEGGINLYGFCAGNPINNTDPFGTQPPYTPGTTVWVDPKTLLTSRQALDTEKVNNVYLKSTQQATHPPAIEITRDGVIIDGNSRARVAAHFGDLIECRVTDTVIKVDQSVKSIMVIPFDKGSPIFIERPSPFAKLVQGARNLWEGMFKGGRGSGSGGAAGAIITIGLGAEAAGKGLRHVLPYAQTTRDVGRALQDDPDHGEIPYAIRWRPQR